MPKEKKKKEDTFEEDDYEKVDTTKKETPPDLESLLSKELKSHPNKRIDMLCHSIRMEMKRSGIPGKFLIQDWKDMTEEEQRQFSELVKKATDKMNS